MLAEIACDSREGNIQSAGSTLGMQTQPDENLKGCIGQRSGRAMDLATGGEPSRGLF
jgi:hypothetical protein